VLRAAEGGTGRLSAVAFGGGIVLAGAIALAAAIQFAGADTAGDVPPEVTQTLSVMNADLFFGFGIGILALLLATGLVVIGTGVLPTWLGWVAIVIGILSVTPAGFIGFLLWIVWTLVASIVLFLREGAAGAPPPAAPGTATGSAP
jgi:hypothetical protein